MPFWHERDGGRYIGTGHVVDYPHPDEDWINVDDRVTVHDRNTMGHEHPAGENMADASAETISTRGRLVQWRRCFGVDPLLHMIATRPEPYGRSEFDAVGGIKGEPVEVNQGEYTGLPIPCLRRDPPSRRVLADQQRRRTVQRMDGLLCQRGGKNSSR